MSLEPGLHSLIPVAILAAIMIGLLSIDRFAFKGVVFALVFFLVAITPVIGLVKVGDQAAADRYTYIPMSVFFVAAACGMFRFLDVFSHTRGTNWLSLGFALFVLGICSWQTILYVPIWQTDEKLWTHVNSQYPMQVADAYLNLGNVEYGMGNSEAALQFYETALIIDSDNIYAQGNLAKVNENLSNNDHAASTYRGLADSRQDSILAQNISAAGMRRLGKLELSAQYYHRALQLAPTSSSQLFESALADHMIGKNAAASKRVRILLQLDGEHRQGRILNVALLFTAGFTKEATMQLDALREEFPGDPQIRQIDLQLQNHN